MSKRRLTGGTGDVKPQILTLTTGNQGGLEDYALSSTALPVPRFGSSRGKATIVELLKVYFYIGLTDIADQDHTTWAFLTTSTNRTNGDTSSLATLVVDIQDPRNFAIAISSAQINTTGASNKDSPQVIDLTDNAGNGVLVATDSITLVHGTVGNTTVTSAEAKLLYRLVNVGVQEYVGIVQSQQL